MDPVNRALMKLVNQNVKYVDSVALSAIASAVTATAAAPASAATMTAQQWITTVMLAKQNIVALNQGYDPDTVVLEDIPGATPWRRSSPPGLTPRETGRHGAADREFPTSSG
jgi:hypothetical protein